MKAYISKNATEQLLKYLKSNDCEIIFTHCDHVHDAIKDHPDIQLCRLKNEIYQGDTDKLSDVYPLDIRYNAACTGKYFIHNLKYTDSDLLKKAENEGLILINVKQGYSKCNIVTVDENSIITSDKGIASSCEGIMDVLLISEGNIILPGFNTGFIGGCSGKLNDTIFFNGDLSKHPDFIKIKDYIENRGLKCLWFKGTPLTDIGSVIIGD